MMDPTLLQTFLAVRRHGSYTEAAKEEFLTQPAVTKSLHELEALLGVTLFERTRAGVVPTPVCAPFVRLAQDVYANLEVATAAMRDLAQGESDAAIVRQSCDRAIQSLVTHDLLAPNAAVQRRRDAAAVLALYG